MLIRFVVENVYSFGMEKEFNMLPYNHLQTLQHHKYNINDFELLKLCALYGANGAGKSNLIKALSLFQEFILEKINISKIEDAKFKFHENDSLKQVFAIEFFQNNIPYFYSVEINKGLVLSEELYVSGLGNKDDRLLFDRKTSEDKITEITFMEEFEKDEKGKLLKDIILEEFVMPNKLIFKNVAEKNNKFLKDIKNAFNWFENILMLITPRTRNAGLAHRLDIFEPLKDFAENTMKSLDIGISSLICNKMNLDDFQDENDHEVFSGINEIKKGLDSQEGKILCLSNDRGDESIFLKEDNKYIHKRIQIEHTTLNNNKDIFEENEESDGTIRLLHFLPAFYKLTQEPSVFIIDEIERSIHPNLIKELVKKFSLDEQTKGQLIFSTHESNLLDQEIFRQDEIWFAEKDKKGSTDLYPLSDFKEHKTKDIRKGYLNGRYGSIPFMGNLENLNWHDYEQTN